MVKTLFAKYNSERLPQYQIVTKIVLDDKNGKKYAIKKPLCAEAKAHIETIFQNYELLKSQYDINLVKPKIDSDNVTFEMAEGTSLEKLMLDAIDTRDIQLFKNYVEKFVSFVDGLVTERDVIFTPSKEFKAIFGEWTVSEPQDIIKVANIDLIFGNIFLADNKFTLIDYEWIFGFDIPKSYIIWRSLYIFSIYHNIDFAKYNLEQFFKYHNEFIRMDDQFSFFVHGENQEYFLNSKVLKANKYIDMNPNSLTCKDNCFIQLFLDYGDGFNEENSIKLPVAKNTETQEFIFDLTDKPSIKVLRLDPLNECCIIEIESLHVKKKDNQLINLLPYVHSNAEMHEGNTYFFTTEDSQICFNGLEPYMVQNTSSCVVVLKYAHISKNALVESQRIIIEQKQNYIEEQQEKIESQRIIIEQKQNYIEEQQEKFNKLSNTSLLRIAKKIRLLKV